MTVWGNNPNQPDHHPACVQHEDHPEFDVDLSEGEMPYYYVTGECTCYDIIEGLKADAAGV